MLKLPAVAERDWSATHAIKVASSICLSGRRKVCSNILQMLHRNAEASTDARYLNVGQLPGQLSWNGGYLGEAGELSIETSKFEIRIKYANYCKWLYQSQVLRHLSLLAFVIKFN